MIVFSKDDAVPSRLGGAAAIIHILLRKLQLNNHTILIGKSLEERQQGEHLPCGLQDQSPSIPPVLPMSMQEQQEPPLFHDIPKSALFSRLEAFLPVMAEENKKLSEKVAAGEGAEHNIEVEEADEASDVDTDDGMAEDDANEKKKKTDEAPVIEMNFALGMMDESDSDGEDSDNVGPKAAIEDRIIACTADIASGPAQQEKETSFQMRHEKPNTKPRPVIQELN